MGSSTHIGIIGDGKMGLDIFNYLSSLRLKISLVCLNEAHAASIRKTYEKKQKRAFKFGLIDIVTYEYSIKNSHIGYDYQLLESCDIIIECIPEELHSKRALFAELINIIPMDCVLCSNSSSLPPEDLLTDDGHGRSLYGLHFFFPVAYKQFVELNLPVVYEEEHKLRLMEFVRLINKQPIPMEGRFRFLANKLMLKLQAECCRLHVQEGLSFHVIDSWVKKHIMPAGVFEFMDQVGIDVMLQSIKGYGVNMQLGQYLELMKGLLENLTLEKKFGVKNDQGFYSYEKGRIIMPAKAVEASLTSTQQNRLYACYLNPIHEVVEKEVMAKDDLAQMVTDYTMSDQDPFDLSNHLQFSYDPSENVF